MVESQHLLLIKGTLNPQIDVRVIIKNTQTLTSEPAKNKTGVSYRRKFELGKKTTSQHDYKIMNKQATDGDLC